LNTKRNSISKITIAKSAEDVVQVVKYLPRKLGTLSSNPSATKKRKGKEIKLF
jgi:hypothetical protein